MRQQRINLGALACGYEDQSFGQATCWIKAVEFSGDEQRLDGEGTAIGADGAGKRSALLAYGDRADNVFDKVIVDREKNPSGHSAAARPTPQQPIVSHGPDIKKC